MHKKHHGVPLSGKNRAKTTNRAIRDTPQVEAQDTSVIAQLGWPDMRLPLLYSLSWPHRVRMSYDQLDLAKLCTS